MTHTENIFKRIHKIVDDEFKQFNDEAEKRAKDEQLLRGEGTALSVGFVRLRAQESIIDESLGPIVRCPLCGLTMVVIDPAIDSNSFDNDASFMCPECGIIG